MTNLSSFFESDRNQKLQKLKEEKQREEIDLVKQYLGIYHDEDNALIRGLISASKKYILDYTGLTEQQYMEHEGSLTVVLFMLVSQYYDNRSMQSLQLKENIAIDNILNLYRNNLVGEDVSN